MKYIWKRDCKSFPGVYACDILKAEGYKDCSECGYYESISKRILIIKLGAMGDVLRTTPLLTAIKAKYGEGSHITWLVNGESLDILKNNEKIDRVFEYNNENLMKLKRERFDTLINLEISSPATLVANEIKAKEKYGYYYDEDGHPSAFNEGAHYYLERVFSDFVNRNNRKSYQEMMFEILDLKFNKEDYILGLDEESLEYGEEFRKRNKIKKNEKVIGINVGSGGRWPSKAWSQDKIVELVKILDKKYKVILLGGLNEVKLLKEIKDKVGSDILTNNPNNTIKEFMGVLNLCSTVLTGDTLALHLAAALKKRVLGLFFCTPHWEIEKYDRIEIIASPLLENRFYSDEYDEELVNSISAKEVYKRINEK